MLHYEINGKGQEVLVLLHGFMENNTIWKRMEGLLSPNFTLVKIDLPGHGKSPILSDSQTMEQMADAVLETLKKLEIQKYHILGHSMGGYVSLALAEKIQRCYNLLPCSFPPRWKMMKRKNKFATEA